MKKCKSYFVMLLAVMLFAGISIQAFAAQAGDVKSTQGCVHNYAAAPTIYSYYRISDTQHKKVATPGKKCTICESIVFDAPVTTYEAHQFHDSYTFENYHSGSEHFCKVKGQCPCGCTREYWDSYPCPGNGNCILPISIDPVLADK